MPVKVGALPEDPRASPPFNRMEILKDIFNSPDFYPLGMNFEDRQVLFTSMSQLDYKRCLFLGMQAAKRRGKGIHHVRLDDLLLAVADVPRAVKPVHFILHTAYCCSTLLARYFELIPSCLVLKEPQFLTQLALTTVGSFSQWNETFDLSFRLLSRVYGTDDVAVIKTNVPCNILGKKILDYDSRTTITFVMIPLRQFLLAALKSQLRRSRVRFWVRNTVDLTAIPQLHPLIAFPGLSDAQAAVCVWLFNRHLCRELHSRYDCARVLMVDGSSLAENPEQVLPQILHLCGLSISGGELESLLQHPSRMLHAKNVSVPYTASSRRQDLEKSNQVFGQEVDAAIKWAETYGFDCDKIFD
jgi:hypothetical protein